MEYNRRNATFAYEQRKKMLTIYDEFIPLITQLNHNDKLRLAQWLINAIAKEEGVSDLELNNNQQQTGLCGIWQDSRSSENIVQEIINNRTSKDIVL